MPKTVLLKDGNYARGMNDIDDPMTLGDGYCAELVNAYPGVPLEMRKGINWSRPFDDNMASYTYNSYNKVLCSCFWKDKLFAFVRVGSVICLVCFDEGKLRRVGFMHVNYDVVFGLADPRETDKYNKLALEPVGSVLYARFQLPIIWQTIYGTWLNDGALNACNMLAVEFGEDGVPKARLIPPAGLQLTNTVQRGSIPHFYVDAETEYEKLWVHTLQVNTPSSAADVGWAQPDGNVEGVYGISVTLVRRTTEVGNVTKVYEPGLIETPEGRLTPDRRVGIAYRIKDKYGLHNIVFQWSSSPQNHFQFTHLRFYRTRNFAAIWNSAGMSIEEKQNIVLGATRYFMVDVPYTGYDTDKSFSVTGMGYVWRYDADIDDKFDDEMERIEVSDGELTGEANTLQSAPYNMPPFDGVYMRYHKGRMFLLGNKGQLYFSEVPGGDGGGDLEMANLYPEKYALWYKLYDRYELGTHENAEATGIAAFDDDLYFFKSNGIWCLVGGAPPSVPRMISDNVGCTAGNTIVTVKVDNKRALFFLGNDAPYLISAGGYVTEFTAFKCKALYRASDVFATAAWWDNKIWVFCAGVGYGYSADAEHPGAFTIVSGETVMNYIAALCVLPNLEPLFLGTESTKDSLGVLSGMGIVVGKFHDGYDDLLYDDYNTKRIPVEFKLRSRRQSPGPLDRNMGELLNATMYCTFDKGIDPFTVEMKSNRFKAIRSYNNAERKEYINNQAPEGKPYMRTNITLIPEADFMGERFEYEIKKRTEAGFDLYGAEMEIIPRPYFDGDDLVGGAANKEIWVDYDESN